MTAILKTSEQLAATNCSAFADKSLDAIVTIASGCGSQMQEYQQAEFAGKVVDISQFLIKSGCDLSDQLLPLAASVCLHTPCSLKNVMREEQGAIKLLQQIPDIKMSAAACINTMLRFGGQLYAGSSANGASVVK